MSAEDLFGLASAAVLPGWLILMLAPRGKWRWLDRIPALVIPFGLSALYTGLILAHFSAAGGGFGSIAQVRALFASDWGLLAGWVHYLAFDLMIGALMATQMDRVGLARISQAPLLALIFLFGPLGVFLIWAAQGALRMMGKGDAA
ncbi:MAG: ABA4-like family protein [Cypionkella sp.]|nr:ABA4-like family protein [Cypionkella sp.]